MVMFQKYSSLENHYNNKFIEKVRFEGKDQGEWVAREKIHGTNFSVIITKDEIQPAKRTGPVLDGESFFDHLLIMKKYRISFEAVQQTLLEGATVQIFGEFAGPGVQKEVSYGDKKDFYVFDVLARLNDEPARYLDDDKVNAFCDFFKLRICPLLGKGKFEELAKLPNDFVTVVPLYNEHVEDPIQGLIEANRTTYLIESAPEGADNVAEGYVLKPVVSAYLRNGDRVAIKCKNSRFTEKKKSDNPIAPKKEMSEADQVLLNSFNEFVTWNRVSNVLSKIGQVNAKMFGRVMGLTLQDVLVEAEREGIDILTADDPSYVKKELSNLIIAEIRTRWHEVVE